ncbi:hypothetical protein P3L10_031206 [Capsicum annuum]
MNTKARSTKLSNIIYHLLAYHVGAISKFVLALDVGDCPEINKLIYFLSRNGIQHLDLGFYPSNQCKLCSSLFTCLQLRHLCLQSCSIPLALRAFKGFGRLINLELRSLGLYHNCYSDAIEISAPMLQTFDFIERIGFICIKTVPNFAKPSLWHVESHLGTGNCFEIISALEHLE